MDQDPEVANHYGLLALVAHFQPSACDAIVFVFGAQFRDFPHGVNRVADEGRPYEAEVVDAVEGSDHFLIETEQGVADDEHQPALNHALAELAGLGELSVSVDGKPVAGQGAEIDDVGFGKGSGP